MWLPGGALALENTGSAVVSLAREVSLTSTAGATPTALELGLDCPTAPAAGGAACISLVPGAAMVINRWPDTRGACRCPPCLEPAASSSFTIHTCSRGQTLSRTLPER